MKLLIQIHLTNEAGTEELLRGRFTLPAARRRRATFSGSGLVMASVALRAQRPILLGRATRWSLASRRTLVASMLEEPSEEVKLARLKIKAAGRPNQRGLYEDVDEAEKELRAAKHAAQHAAHQKAMQVTQVGAAANLALAISKGTIGLSVASTGLVADAANSLGDLLSDAVVYYTVSEARKRATPDRPWGMGKLEPLGKPAATRHTLTATRRISYTNRHYLVLCYYASALCSLLSALCSLLSAHCSLLSALYSLLSALYSLLTALCSLLSAHCSLLSARCSLLSISQGRCRWAGCSCSQGRVSGTQHCWQP
jgi:hypothetical protein